jgi:hypothetical protein
MWRGRAIVPRGRFSVLSSPCGGSLPGLVGLGGRGMCRAVLPLHRSSGSGSLWHRSLSGCRGQGRCGNHRGHAICHDCNYVVKQADFSNGLSDGAEVESLGKDAGPRKTDVCNGKNDDELKENSRRLQSAPSNPVAMLRTPVGSRIATKIITPTRMSIRSRRGRMYKIPIASIFSPSTMSVLQSSTSGADFAPHYTLRIYPLNGMPRQIIARISSSSGRCCSECSLLCRHKHREAGRQNPWGHQ